MKGRELKFKSKLEKQVYDIVVEILNDLHALFTPRLHYYIPDIELEVDIAIPELLIAIEVQGEQHRDKDHFFNKKYVGKFQKQISRDKFLREMLEINGWKLIEVYPEDIDKGKIKNMILEG